MIADVMVSGGTKHIPHPEHSTYCRSVVQSTTLCRCHWLIGANAPSNANDRRWRQLYDLHWDLVSRLL